MRRTIDVQAAVAPHLARVNRKFDQAADALVAPTADERLRRDMPAVYALGQMYTAFQNAAAEFARAFEAGKRGGMQ